MNNRIAPLPGICDISLDDLRISVHHPRVFVLFLASLFFFFGPALHQSCAQVGGVWNKVDTVTSGPEDDANPVIGHNSPLYSTDGLLRMVFERHTSSESQIVAMKFRTDIAAWDSSSVVLSATPSDEQQELPDYSETYYYSDSPHALRMAAWQRWKDNRWQLYYATLQDSSLAWSPSAPLVSDSLDNTSVRIRPYRDSVMIVTWKRANTVMALFKTPSTTSQPETLGVSTLDSLTYDLSTSWGLATVVWTSRSGDQDIALYRLIDPYALPPVTPSVPETVSTSAPCYNPHLAISWFGNPSILFESPSPGSWQVFLWTPYHASLNISNDQFADNRNAHAYSSPVITKPTAGSGTLSSPFDVCVYERTSGNDSALVFLQGYWSDTVHTPGHNRNACVGSQGVIFQSKENAMVVWESNRSGTSHIYSRLVSFFVDAGPEPSGPPRSFVLQQNYPNPFNPRTNIGFEVSARSRVKLEVFDLLGREVKVLVDKVEEAGKYTVPFDGSAFASGVYFYRLVSGSFVQTRSMLLVK